MQLHPDFFSPKHICSSLFTARSFFSFTYLLFWNVMGISQNAQTGQKQPDSASGQAESCVNGWHSHIEREHFSVCKHHGKPFPFTTEATYIHQRAIMYILAYFLPVFAVSAVVLCTISSCLCIYRAPQGLEKRLCQRWRHRILFIQSNNKTSHYSAQNWTLCKWYLGSPFF